MVSHPRWCLGKVVLAWALSAALACAPVARSARLGWTAPMQDAQRRCDAGQMPACGELGRALVADVESQRDVEEGTVLLEAACAQDDFPSCAALGAVYLQQRNDKSTARARELVTRACDQAFGPACSLLGEILVRDRSNPQLARAAFEKGCQLGDSHGCELFGTLASREGMDADPAGARQAFTVACGMGRRSSCHRLALLELADPAGAAAGIALLDKNCQGGFVPSCLALATFYAPIVSRAPDCAGAAPSAQRACDGKDADGCAIADACELEAKHDGQAAAARLWSACQRGNGLACFYWADAQPPATLAPLDAPPGPLQPTDVERAYLAACRGRSPASKLACARYVALELPKAENAQRAEGLSSFLQKACEESEGEACCALGELYRQGSRFLAADPDKASALRAKACGLGQTRCCP